MKNLFFSTVYLFFSFVAFSQIEIGSKVEKNKIIGKVYRGGEKFGVFISSLEQSGKDTSSYILCFNNLLYQNRTDIKCISFSASKNDILQLFNFFKDCLEKDKNTKNSIKLGEAEIEITSIRNLGVKSLEVSVISPLSKQGFFNITIKEVDRLFQDLDK